MQYDNPSEAWSALAERTKELDIWLSESQWLELEEWESCAARFAVSMKPVRTSKRSLFAFLRRAPESAQLGNNVSRFGGPPIDREKYADRDFLARVCFAEIAGVGMGLPTDGILDITLVRARRYGGAPVGVRFHTESTSGDVSHAPYRLHECSVKFQVVPTVDAPDVRPRDSRHRECPAPGWLQNGNVEMRSAWDMRSERIERKLGVAPHLLLPDWSKPLLNFVGERRASEQVPLLRIEDDPLIGMKLGTNTIYVLADRDALEQGRIEGVTSVLTNA